MKFENPANGYQEEATNCGLWCFLFGPFYFAAKGVWTHAFISAGAALATGGLSWIVYPFYATRIVRTNYLRKGWREP